MENLIRALGSDIKPRGKNQWMARCRVHNDKDFAMSIKQCQDGSIVAYCFACQANGLDLYNNLGLDLDELFGGKKGDFMPQSIKDQLSEDKMFIAIYESDVEKGVKPKLTEKKRYKLALARSEGIRNKFNLV